MKHFYTSDCDSQVQVQAHSTASCAVSQAIFTLTG